jgi:hypothetical protein
VLLILRSVAEFYHYAYLASTEWISSPTLSFRRVSYYVFRCQKAVALDGLTEMT